MSQAPLLRAFEVAQIVNDRSDTPRIDWGFDICGAAPGFGSLVRKRAGGSFEYVLWAVQPEIRAQFGAQTNGVIRSALDVSFP